MEGMGYEITTTVTVGPNGHIEADLPELQEGQRLRLVVFDDPEPPGERRGLVGCLRGNLLSMSDDFDDPLPQFAEYQ